jgi:hypothetical protein
LSHVVKNTNEKGRILSIAALEKACLDLTVDGRTGLLELVQTEKGKGKYRTWKSDHGRLVGDWDVPEGMTSDEVGANADYVIRATAAGRAYLKSKGYNHPYEVGVVWDEADQCYRLVYDFFCRAQGLELLIGETKVDYKKSGRSGQLTTSCPRLIQAYNVARDGLLAAAQGDTQVVVPQADGSVLVGTAGDFLTLPDGTKIPLGPGDIVAEIGVGTRLGSGLGGVQ